MKGKQKLAVATTALSIETVGLILALVAASVFAAPARAASLPGGGIVSVTVTGPRTATITGIVNPGGLTTSYAVVYDVATSVWCSTNGASGGPAYSAFAGTALPTTGLHPYPRAFAFGLGLPTQGLQYCVAVRATNSLGTVTGPPYRRFTSGAPAASAGSLTSTSSTTATFYGAVNPASQDTAYQVHYDLASSTWCSSNGTTGTPTYATAPQTLPYTDGGTLQSVFVSIAGLTSGTSYCATIAATNTSASASGSVLGFTLDVPGVLNSNVAVTGATTATFNGAVNAFGQNNFHYGARYDFANSTWCASKGSIPDATTVWDNPQLQFSYTDSVFHPVSVDVPALTPGTEYCETIEAGNTQAAPIYFATTG
jgi:hypothetical protein